MVLDVDYMRIENGHIINSNGALGSIIVDGVTYDTSRLNTGIGKKNYRDTNSNITKFKGSR